jgi:hypothetical protein
LVVELLYDPGLKAAAAAVLKEEDEAEQVLRAT